MFDEIPHCEGRLITHPETLWHCCGDRLSSSAMSYQVCGPWLLACFEGGVPSTVRSARQKPSLISRREDPYAFKVFATSSMLPSSAVRIGLRIYALPVPSANAFSVAMPAIELILEDICRSRDHTADSGSAHPTCHFCSLAALRFGPYFQCPGTPLSPYLEQYHLLRCHALAALSNFTPCSGVAQNFHCPRILIGR